MRIDFLADHPEYIPILAPPIREHWRFALTEDTVDVRAAKLRAHANHTGLPIAWVAHANAEVFGTAALRVHDLEGREDLTPWLSGVFVLQTHRGKGIGSALCAAVEAHARRNGVPKLYLFTLDHQRMYARLGWQKFERTTWRGHDCEIMVKELRAA
jgi:GNAT superfamily N-acetyltransferase